jgi:hypothetical protein
MMQEKGNGGNDMESMLSLAKGAMLTHAADRLNSRVIVFGVGEHALVAQLAHAHPSR